MDQVLRPLSPGCGFAQLLCNPLISGSSGNNCTHDSARMQFHDHKDIHWAEEQIIHDGEITGPDILDMVLHECTPALARPITAHFEHVILDRPLTHLDPQLRSSPRMRSAPHNRFSLAICLINPMVSGEMRGSRFSDFDFRRQ